MSGSTAASEGPRLIDSDKDKISGSLIQYTEKIRGEGDFEEFVIGPEIVPLEISREVRGRRRVLRDAYDYSGLIFRRIGP